MKNFAPLPLSAATSTEFGASTRVYIVIAWHGRRNGRCNCKVPTIAKETGLHERTVQRAIRKLERAMLIAVEARTTIAGDPDTNVYVLLGAEGVVAELPPGGGEPATRVVAHVATRVVAQRATTRIETLNRDSEKERGPARDGSRRLPDEHQQSRIRIWEQTGVWHRDVWGEPPSEAA